MACLPKSLTFPSMRTHPVLSAYLKVSPFVQVQVFNTPNFAPFVPLVSINWHIASCFLWNQAAIRGAHSIYRKVSPFRFETSNLVRLDKSPGWSIQIRRDDTSNFSVVLNESTTLNCNCHCNDLKYCGIIDVAWFPFVCNGKL